MKPLPLKPVGRVLSVHAVYWCVVLALAVNFIRLAWLHVEANGLTRRVTPYTVTLVEQSSGILYTTAVRSDGARLLGWDRHGAGIKTPESKRLLKIEVDDAKKIRSSIQDRARVNPIAYYHDPRNSCLDWLVSAGSARPQKLMAKRLLNGYRAAQVRDERSGSITSRALDYGCAVIGDEMPLGGGRVSIKTLVELRGAEPADSLFYVPAGYLEAPPSRYASTVNDAARDDYYSKHRPD